MEETTPRNQAKAEPQNAAILSAQAVAGQAAADRSRYESVQSRAVSATQLDLSKAQAGSTAANVEVARNQAGLPRLAALNFD
jgi:hypothetical protein